MSAPEPSDRFLGIHKAAWVLYGIIAIGVYGGLLLAMVLA